jgi:enamine deaminase RidA (YjgF/YER057c/UK114 family)
MIAKLVSHIITICILGITTSSVAWSQDSIDARMARELIELGYKDGKFPPLPKPFGSYEDYVVIDKVIYLTSSAGLTSDGEWIRGIVPTQVSAADAIIASKQACIHSLNRLKHAVDGDFSKVRKIAQVRNMTASPPSFIGYTAIANGCSDMLIRVFGAEIGKHTRSIFGVSSFPSNITHEVEMTVYIH